MPRFVILTHDHPHLHWDFFLEEGDVLRGWRLAEEPAARKLIAATCLPDHRKFYLDYEGPVSADRGSVTRWDFGSYSSEPPSREASLRASRIGAQLILQITGTRLHGRVELQHVADTNWTWTFHPM
ncbi:MAG TPA: DNA polymerase ligase N-terminal domain-containing protein [Gemmataceae bacterium]|nr:DNA polymerase ligase N-terminal domain-containing protein [Gemmataceae bacterium]